MRKRVISRPINTNNTTLTSRSHSNSKSRFLNSLLNHWSTRPEVWLRMKKKSYKRRIMCKSTIFKHRKTMKSKMFHKPTNLKNKRNNKQFSCQRMRHWCSKHRARSTYRRRISNSCNRNLKLNRNSMQQFQSNNKSSLSTCPKTRLLSRKLTNQADHSLR